jgi:hypothetical protein
MDADPDVGARKLVGRAAARPNSQSKPFTPPHR